MTQLVGWGVSLSSGETFHENKNEYSVIQGQPSPWLRLSSYIKTHNLKITSLFLYNDCHRWNLPSAGNNPRFSIFSEIEKPTSYRFFRKIGADISGEDQEQYAVIEAVYQDKKLQVFVNEKYPHASWSVIV
jgi:hypothetical protein